jgi:hypothetical protein
MTDDEVKTLLDQAAQEMFDIIPSYFDARQAKTIVGVMASLVLRLSSHVEQSSAIREMLERYSAAEK